MVITVRSIVVRYGKYNILFRLRSWKWSINVCLLHIQCPNIEKYTSDEKNLKVEAYGHIKMKIDTQNGSKRATVLFDHPLTSFSVFLLLNCFLSTFFLSLFLSFVLSFFSVFLSICPPSACWPVCLLAGCLTVCLSVCLLFGLPGGASLMPSYLVWWLIFVQPRSQAFSFTSLVVRQGRQRKEPGIEVDLCFLSFSLSFDDSRFLTFLSFLISFFLSFSLSLISCFLSLFSIFHASNIYMTSLKFELQNYWSSWDFT